MTIGRYAWCKRPASQGIASVNTDRNAAERRPYGIYTDRVAVSLTSAQSSFIEGLAPEFGSKSDVLRWAVEHVRAVVEGVGGSQ